MTDATEIQHSPADPRLRALLETAQGWTLERGLILTEIEYVVGQASKLVCLYQGCLTAEKLPAFLKTPSELMVWARPKRAEGDVTGLEQSANWFARWLVLCMPWDEELQNEVCCQILIRAQSRAQRFVY